VNMEGILPVLNLTLTLPPNPVYKTGSIQDQKG
jgi:hypothetical protein